MLFRFGQAAELLLCSICSTQKVSDPERGRKYQVNQKGEIMRTKAGMLASNAAFRFAERIALTTEAGHQTFRELDQAANRLASGLLSIGLASGDRVGVLSHNRAEVMHAWLACERADLVRLVLHSHFDMATHRDTVRHVGASAILFDTRFKATLESCRDQFPGVRHFIAIGDDPPDWAMPLDAVLARGSADPLDLDVDEDSPNFIQPTTGTTGAPKPWIVTQRSWTAMVNQNLIHLDSFATALPPIGPDDVSLHVHALQWASGGQTLYPYFVRGSRTVLMDDETFDAERLVATILDEGVTGVLLPAHILAPMLDIVERRGGIPHRLKRVIVFFATPELLTRTTQLLGPVWCHGYGSTEQGAIGTRLLYEETIGRPHRLGSVGRGGSPFYECSVVDHNGDPVANGRAGEIVVRSAMSNSRYWEMPEKTQASFFPGGWFRTGDVGTMDEDGFLYYVDRAKDAVHTTGSVIYPHEIEANLLSHPAVHNVGVVGLGEAGRQQIVAAVVLKSGQAKSEALRSAIARLAPVNDGKPIDIRFVDELPAVLGGAKVQREVLRERLEMERA